MTDKKPDFETALAELNQTVEQLEKGDCTLEESIALFTVGMNRLKDCRQALEQAEQKITKLTQEEEDHV